MTPEQLADEIVALGVGFKRGSLYYIGVDPLTAGAFVEHDSVAMAMMERVIEWGGFEFIGSCTSDTFQATAYRGYGPQKRSWHGVNANLPRAINEACAAALREGKCR